MSNHSQLFQQQSAYCLRSDSQNSLQIADFAGGWCSRLIIGRPCLLLLVSGYPLWLIDRWGNLFNVNDVQFFLFTTKSVGLTFYSFLHSSQTPVCFFAFFISFDLSLASRYWVVITLRMFSCYWLPVTTVKLFKALQGPGSYKDSWETCITCRYITDRFQL